MRAFMMKNKPIIILAFVIGLLFGWLICFWGSDTNEGNVYLTKEELCIHFVQSYLKTIPKVEPDYSDEKWDIAVDVETDLYNICLLDLNKEALKNFKPTAIEKYRN
jgi:hypothetical protein